MNQLSHPVAAEAAAAGPARFTSDEFADLVRAGVWSDIRLELIDGELARMNPPQMPHSNRQAQVVGKLWAILADRVLVEIGIRISDDTVLGCDAMVLAVARNEPRFVAPADVILAVEVAESSIDRDMGMKRAKYAGAGIPTYWVVDGARAVVHVFSEPVDGDYAMVSTVRFGEPLAMPGTDASIVID